MEFIQLASHIVLEFNASSSRPHPLDLDRRFRALVAALHGQGPLAIALLPDRVELLILAGYPQAAALAARCARLLPTERPARAQIQSIESASFLDDTARQLDDTARQIEALPMRRGLAGDLLAWRWTSAWERSGLRGLENVGAEELAQLLPQVGQTALPPAPSRAFPGYSLAMLADVAALSIGLNPVELRAVNNGQALAARHLGLALAVHQGWLPSEAQRGLDLGLPIPSPEPTRLQHAIRLLGAVQSGRVRLERPLSAVDLARGRHVRSDGPMLARTAVARRAALSR